MTAPFRENTALVDGNEALAKLEKEEPLPLAFRVAFFGTTLYTPDKGDPIAGEKFRKQAEDAGFRYAGRYSFSGLLGRPPRERWVHPSGMASLSMRRESGNRLENEMSRYYISSTFDDGSAIVTWSKAPPIASTERATQRAGTENIADDYAAHIEAVQAYAEKRHLRILRVDDLETALRASTWYDSRLADKTLVNLRLQFRATILAMVGYLVYKLVMLRQ